MKKLLTALLLFAAAPLWGALPPVFPAGMSDTLEHDDRARTYLPPVRILWTQNDDLIMGKETLFKRGDGQSPMKRDDPFCVLSSRDGKRPSLLLDFGREIQGGLQLVSVIGNVHRPVKVRVRLGESVSEAMSEITPENGGTNDHAVRDFMLEIPWYGVSEIGNSGFRFARIDLAEDDVVLPLKEIRAVFTYRDLPYLGSFRSSDRRLDSIWMTGAYTVHLNMQQYLWDGIKRDRLVWLGDMHPELRTVLSVFGDNVVLRKNLDLARTTTPLPGWMNGMCAYTLWWVMIHRDYYMYSGDKAYLAEQRDYLRRLLPILMGNVDASGREHLQGGRFLDWPTSENPAAIDAGLHALLLLSLEAGAQLCDALGETALADECRTTAGRMRSVVPDYAASKQSAGLAAMAGLVPAEKANEVLSKGGVENYSTFYGYYMLEGKALAGDYVGATADISRYWGAMLDLGATSFWEDFDIRWTENAARIDELVPADKVDVHSTYGAYCYKGLRHSLCHGWASGPTAWLSEHVLGVQIVSPGCTEVRVRPNLGHLQWVEGAVPTPRGVIHVRHERMADGSMQSKIEAPKGVKVVR